MSEDRSLAEYGLRPDQEDFIRVYVKTGEIEEAARQSGRRVSTCRNWLKNPKFQQAVQRELKLKLANGAMSGLDVLINLMHNAEDDKTKLSAARDIMDRAGWKPEHLHTSADKRMEGASMNEVMGRIQELQKELGISSGNATVIENGPQPTGREAERGAKDADEPAPLPAPPTPDSGDLDVPDKQPQATEPEPEETAVEDEVDVSADDPDEDMSVEDLM